MKIKKVFSWILEERLYLPVLGIVSASTGIYYSKYLSDHYNFNDLINLLPLLLGFALAAILMSFFYDFS